MTSYSFQSFPSAVPEWYGRGVKKFRCRNDVEKQACSRYKVRNMRRRVCLPPDIRAQTVKEIQSAEKRMRDECSGDGLKSTTGSNVYENILERL